MPTNTGIVGILTIARGGGLEIGAVGQGEARLIMVAVVGVEHGEDGYDGDGHVVAVSATTMGCSDYSSGGGSSGGRDGGL